MQLTDFISLFNEVLVVVFSVHLLFSSRGNKLLNQLLALFFIGKASNYILFQHYIMEKWMVPELLFFPLIVLFFLSPAIFYLYIRSFVGDEKKLRQSDWWHLLPVALIVIFQLLLREDIAGKNSWNYHSYSFANVQLIRLLEKIVPRLGFILFYLFLSFKVVWRENNKGYPLLPKSSRNWILFLIILSFFQLLLSIPNLYILLTSNADTYNVQIKKIVFSGNIIFFISIIYIILNPVVLYGYLLINPIEKMASPSPDTSGAQDIAQEVQDDNPMDLLIPLPQIDVLIEVVQQYMTQQKPWLQPDFNITQMSYDLGKPVHHCSYILNEGLGISFRDCINQYRVQYFIEQYPQRRYFLTLEAISKESGFKNESTFYKVFKKEKGVTPGRYFN